MNKDKRLRGALARLVASGLAATATSAVSAPPVCGTLGRIYR
ncbi:hypothetical protein [Paraburkholderia domus]|nr:hypothetical protein [Paraburkholderia domus]